MINKALTKLGAGIQHHQLIRRLLLLWAVIIITVVTYVVFTDPPNIPSGTATAYGIVVGLLATVIALYKWSRDRDAQRKQREKQDGDN